MGIWNSKFSSPQKEAESLISARELADFREFMSRHYRGDYDDFAQTMVDAFRKWSKQKLSTSGFDAFHKYPNHIRTYVVVPFAKKDEFKTATHGRWDAARKLWFCYPHMLDHEFAEFCSARNWQPIVKFQDGVVKKIYNAALMKKHFGDGSSPTILESIENELDNL